MFGPKIPLVIPDDSKQGKPMEPLDPEAPVDDTSPTLTGDHMMAVPHA